MMRMEYGRGRVGIESTGEVEARVLVKVGESVILRGLWSGALGLSSGLLEP